MPTREIHQFCAGFSSGDAISNEALLIQEHLRQRGYHSQIYCESFRHADADKVVSYRHYRPRRHHTLLYHHSFRSTILQQLADLPGRKVLLFHNVTPASYVAPYNRRLAAQLRLASEELQKLRHSFDALLADSAFNRDDLLAAGFPEATVMPVPFEKRLLLPEEVSETTTASSHANGHLHFLRDGRINLLFVGRIFPNKRHQDLLKTFALFRRIHPKSRLIFVGSFHPATRGYTEELRQLTLELGVADDVIFTGLVSQPELIDYYRHADLFLSMSEHEGFFVPLLESMFFSLPIVAYSTTAIPETLGPAGIQFYDKEYAAVAELLALLVETPSLRQKIIAGQQRRLDHFSASESLAILDRALSHID